jgi:hypothetical protein
VERDAGRERPRGPERGALSDEATSDPAVEAIAPAPVGRRLAAGLLDAGLLLVALGLILVTELAFASEGEIQLFSFGWFVVFAPLFFALYHAYGTGATPGQLELRIGLRDTSTGARPGLSRAIGRAYLGFAFLILVLPALIDLLLLASGRSLRDRMTRTSAVAIALEGKAPELAGETTPELAAIFEVEPGTRRYLRRGWALLRARPRLVVGTVAAVYVVLLAVAVILAFLVVADAPDEWAIAWYSLLAVALLASGVYWTQAAVVVAVEDARVGGPDASVWATLVRSSRRVNALTAALLLLLVAGSFSVYVLFLSVVLVGRVTLVAPALVLEDTRVLGAFRRSWQLTRGQTLRLLGLFFLSWLVLWGAGLAVWIPAGMLSAIGETAGLVTGLVLGAMALVLALSWLCAAWALVYEDARRARPPGGSG